MSSHLSKLQASAEGYSVCDGPPFRVFLKCLLPFIYGTRSSWLLVSGLLPPSASWARALKFAIFYLLFAIPKGGLAITSPPFRPQLTHHDDDAVSNVK